MLPILCFASTYITVFALGLQSLNVNQRHYWAAAATSAFISTGNIALYRYMPTAGMAEFIGYYLGGMTGITSSIWFHDVVRAWWKGTADRRAAVIAWPLQIVSWPPELWRVCILELERWYEEELARINPEPQCSRCLITLSEAKKRLPRLTGCPRPDCPYLGTDIH